MQTGLDIDIVQPRRAPPPPPPSPLVEADPGQRAATAPLLPVRTCLSPARAHAHAAFVAPRRATRCGDRQLAARSGRARTVQSLVLQVVGQQPVQEQVSHHYEPLDTALWELAPPLPRRRHGRVSEHLAGAGVSEAASLADGMTGSPSELARHPAFVIGWLKLREAVDAASQRPGAAGSFSPAARVHAVQQRRLLRAVGSSQT